MQSRWSILEELMIKYKAIVNYLDDGWHCCITPEKIGENGERVHVTGCSTPIEALNDAIEMYKEQFGDNVW